MTGIHMIDLPRENEETKRHCINHGVPLFLVHWNKTKINKEQKREVWN